MEGSPLHRLQIAWREVVQDLWRRREALRGLSPEEARIVGVLAEHPEYAAFWEDPGQVTEQASDNGVNPYLHAQIHSMVESQIALDHPREVRHGLDRLLRAGLSRHEAIHRIGEILVRSMRPPGPGSPPFDPGRYRQDLKTLAP
jgi:hypothetical protein